jgi:hypothetical protein
MFQARQGKARQDKARQGKARQGKARQGKARQGKARQGKARQGRASKNLTTTLLLGGAVSIRTIHSSAAQSCANFALPGWVHTHHTQQRSPKLRQLCAAWVGTTLHALEDDAAGRVLERNTHPQPNLFHTPYPTVTETIEHFQLQGCHCSGSVPGACQCSAS